jgi:hypothetical protein
VQNGTVLSGSTTQSVPVIGGSTGNFPLTVPGGTLPGTYTLQATYTDANGKQYPAQSISSATLKINSVQPQFSLTTVAGPNQSVFAGATFTLSPIVNEGSVKFTLTNSSEAPVGTPVTVQVANGVAGPVTLASNLPAGSYTVHATYSDTNGGFQSSSAQPQTVTIPPLPIFTPPPPPFVPPPLSVPPLLGFLNAILGGSESVNAAAETETIVDNFFGIPLIVATFNSSGNLVSVTLFGINITFLFG